MTPYFRTRDGGHERENNLPNCTQLGWAELEWKPEEPHSWSQYCGSDQKDEGV